MKFCPNYSPLTDAFNLGYDYADCFLSIGENLPPDPARVIVPACDAATLRAKYGKISRSMISNFWHGVNLRVKEYEKCATK